MWRYIDSKGALTWIKASEQVALDEERGPHYARQIRGWARAFISARKLPENIYGTWKDSLIDDEDLANELHLYLQLCGKYVTSRRLVEYMDKPEVRDRWKLTKGICESTARRWMTRMGYRWRKAPGGQYIDGHERPCVVKYRQEVFLPRWKQIERNMKSWSDDGSVEFVLPREFWPWDESGGPRPYETRRYCHNTTDRGLTRLESSLD